MFMQLPVRAGALLMSSVVIVLAGCAVGPEYRAPAVPEANEYMGAKLVEERQGVPAAPDLAVWWRGFNDPGLDRVVARALSENLELAQAIARVRQARAQVQFAHARLLPAGEASAQAAAAHLSREDQLGRVQSAFPGFDRNQDLYDVGIGASWEIDLFGGLRRGAEAARADYQSAEALHAAAQLSVVAESANTYMLVRMLQARLQIAREQAETRRQLTELVRLRFSRGLTPRSQLDLAEGAYAEAVAAVPVLDADLQSALNALDVLMGATPGTYRAELQNVAAIPMAPAVQSAGGPAALIRRRPDVIAAERRVAASNARIGEALAEYYPKLSLSALLGSATTVGGNLFTSDANTAAGVAGLRWRLFDFGRVDAAVESARGSNAEALAAYRLAVLQATADVENAFAALVRREIQAAALKDGERSLTRAREATEAAYSRGVSSLLDVLDADDRLHRTQDQRALAEFETARAAIASFRALGGGWDGPQAAATS